MIPTSAIIVAGGRSTRLGQDKRRLRLWGDHGPTLLEHTVGIAASLCDKVVVVLNDPESWPNLAARLVPDRWPDAGPLGGIGSGLQALQHEWALVLSADLPLLNVALLRTMLNVPRAGDVLVPHRETASPDDPLAPRNRRGFEPLHALYRRTCLTFIEAQLATGNNQIIGFFPQVQVQIFGPEQIGAIDSEYRSFSNINTPEHLGAVQQIIDATALC